MLSGERPSENNKNNIRPFEFGNIKIKRMPIYQIFFVVSCWSACRHPFKEKIWTFILPRHRRLVVETTSLKRLNFKHDSSLRLSSVPITVAVKKSRTDFDFLVGIRQLFGRFRTNPKIPNFKHDSSLRLSSVPIMAVKKSRTDFDFLVGNFLVDLERTQKYRTSNRPPLSTEIYCKFQSRTRIL